MEDEKNSHERNTKTVSPPLLIRERQSSLESSSTRKNFHERNLEKLKTITDKNMQKLKQIEEEKRKLEITRQRLAQKVLSKNAEVKRMNLARSEEVEGISRNTGKIWVESIKEEEEFKSSNSIKVDHKMRNLNYIQNLQDLNKAKVQQKEEKEIKKLNYMKKLRENFGLHNVNSKVVEAEERRQSKMKEDCKKVVQKPKDEEKMVQKPKKEENLLEIDDKKKNKRSDDQCFQRLIQQPKRFSGVPIITDMGVFKKKNSLSEKDKIFIINGCYPDIRKALIKRSNSYTGRLV